MNTRTKNTTSESTPITWSTGEARHRPRWWVFVLVGYATPLISLIVLGLGNWSASLALAAIGITFFVVYLPRPKVWKYRLADSTLTVTREHRRGPADELTLTLSNYRAIKESTVLDSADHKPRTVLTLMPVKRLALGVDIPMPTDAVKASRIEQILTNALGQAPAKDPS
jgi:hypothetical protein